MKNPDLLKVETVISPAWRKVEREARIARYSRWRDFKYGQDRKRRVRANPSPKAVPETAPGGGTGGCGERADGAAVLG